MVTLLARWRRSPRPRWRRAHNEHSSSVANLRGTTRTSTTMEQVLEPENLIARAREPSATNSWWPVTCRPQRTVGRSVFKRPSIPSRLSKLAPRLPPTGRRGDTVVWRVDKGSLRHLVLAPSCRARRYGTIFSCERDTPRAAEHCAHSSTRRRAQAVRVRATPRSGALTEVSHTRVARGERTGRTSEELRTESELSDLLEAQGPSRVPAHARLSSRAARRDLRTASKVATRRRVEDVAAEVVGGRRLRLGLDVIVSSEGGLRRFSDATSSEESGIPRRRATSSTSNITVSRSRHH